MARYEEQLMAEQSQQPVGLVTSSSPQPVQDAQTKVRQAVHSLLPTTAAFFAIQGITARRHYKQPL